MTHQTFVAGLLLRNFAAQQKLRMSYLAAESCNKSHNKNLNRDQLYSLQLVAEKPNADWSILVYVLI